MVDQVVERLLYDAEKLHRTITRGWKEDSVWSIEDLLLCTRLYYDEIWKAPDTIVITIMKY